MTPTLAISPRALLLLTLTATLIGCGPGDPGSGNVTLSLAANQAITRGFPHSENGVELAFVDGWQLTIDRYVVGIGAFTLREPAEGGGGEEVAQWRGPVLADLASRDNGEVVFGELEDVPAKRLDVGFTMVRASADATLLGVSQELADEMTRKGWSTFVEVTATPTAQNTQFTQPVTLRLGFTIAADYYDCNNGIDLTKGLVVEPNKTINAYIFPHLVHLFWDRLAGGNEKLLLNPMAAAAREGVVTSAELETVDLTTLFDTQSGVPYDDDGGLLDDYTLAAYADRAMLESMHFNGVGFCKKRLL